MRRWGFVHRDRPSLPRQRPDRRRPLKRIRRPIPGAGPPGDFGHSYAFFYHRNLLKPIFKDGSINTTLANSTLHEIYSYMGKEEAVENYLALKFAQLKSGGRFVARDIVGPTDREKTIHFVVEGEIQKDFHKKPIAETNPAERFVRFINASPWVTKDMRDKMSFHPHNGKRTRFVTTLGIAMEFAHRIDYVESWEPELLETYCFWTINEWIQKLEQAGFHVSQETQSVREEWLVENRFANRMELQTTGGERLAWPETHQILVAEKP